VRVWGRAGLAGRAPPAPPPLPPTSPAPVAAHPSRPPPRGAPLPLPLLCPQAGELTRLLLTRASAGGGSRALPYPHDVLVDYGGFLDELYGGGGM